MSIHILQEALFVVALITVGHVAASIGLDVTALDHLWLHWKVKHQKQYADPQEQDRRRGVWLDNVAQIMHHNVKHDLGLVSYSMGLNQYADLSWEEFRERYLPGLLSSDISDHGGIPFDASQVTVVAESVDWRKQGLVRAVKSQGGCHSCWAFAVTGAVEGQYAKKYNKTLEFSEQQLVDCSGSFGNRGCHGGLMVRSFRYLERFGLEPESSYPYLGHDEQCKFDPSAALIKVKSFRSLSISDEKLLKAMVSRRGPVSAAVDADQGLQLYRSGIYQSDQCSSTKPNHAVLVVGYDTEEGTGYWIVKNSWGTEWGEAGYMRLIRDHGNMCGIAKAASVPELQ